MISIAVKALLQDNRFIQFQLPDNIKLKAGEYEIIIVINAPVDTTKKKRILSFSNHNYYFENPASTFNRNDIYGDFGR